jgi:hypothetical protein
MRGESHVMVFIERREISREKGKREILDTEQGK